LLRRWVWRWVGDMVGRTVNTAVSKHSGNRAVNMARR
jgi:hypothetical protein